MENRKELLQKLGFSEDYLKFIDSENPAFFYEPVQPDLFESKFQAIELTSFVIDKSEKPINSNFIFNEK